MSRLRIYLTLAILNLMIPGLSAAADFKLTIIHINDPHAHYLPYQESSDGQSIGGYARIAGMIKGIRARAESEGRRVLFLCAGDILTGTPFSTVFKGRMGVDLLASMGLDAMTVGNHEFDYAAANLIELKNTARFPFLSANIFDENGIRLFAPEWKYSNQDVTIRVIGLTTRSTPYTTFPTNVAGLRFSDPINTAKELLENRSDNANSNTHNEKIFTIALTHLGVDVDKQLAVACPDINVIVGGHSHTALFQPIVVGKTLIVQAGAYAKYLGIIDIDVENDQIVRHSGRLELVSGKYSVDEEIYAKISKYAQQMGPEWFEIIGRLDFDLQGSLHEVRSGKPTLFGKLLGYVTAKAAETKVAMLNGGLIRSMILKGDVTKGEINTALPFKNSVYRVTLSGADIESILQRSHNLKMGSGGKLQVFGIDYFEDAGKITIRQIGGAAFDQKQQYVVAVNDFLYAGGDGYSIFKRHGKSAQDTGALVSDLVTSFIKERHDITEKDIAGLWIE